MTRWESHRRDREVYETEERVVQTGEGDLRKDVVTEQKPIPAAIMHEEVVSERGPLSEEQIDTTPISEEETIPVSEEQASVTTLSTHTEKNRHVRRFPNGLLLGLGVGLLGIGLLVAFSKGLNMIKTDTTQKSVGTADWATCSSVV